MNDELELSRLISREIARMKAVTPTGRGRELARIAQEVGVDREARYITQEELEDTLLSQTGRFVITQNKVEGRIFPDNTVYTLTHEGQSFGAISLRAASEGIVEDLVIAGSARIFDARKYGCDDLTGLATRGVYDSQLDISLRKNQKLGVYMVDIDHFKKVNDTYGHDKGDLVIKAVASALVKSVRPTDIVARYGGEEFTILTYGTDRELNAKIANRILDNVRSLDVEGINPTVSIGYVSVPGRISLTGEQVLKKADQALYHSKNNGRNQATVYTSRFRNTALPPRSPPPQRE